MIPASIQKAMDEKVAQLAPQLESKIKALFNTARYKSSGQLGGSVRVSYTKSSGDRLPVISIQFAIQGKILDIKKVLWGGHYPNIGNLKQWVETRGTSRFSYIPGYKNGSVPTDPAKAQQRIYFAVAKSQQLNNKWNPKKWKAKNIGDFKRLLNEDTTRIWAELSAREIKHAITA